jgi:hypothetical protein
MKLTDFLPYSLTETHLFCGHLIQFYNYIPLSTFHSKFGFSDKIWTETNCPIE